MSDRFHTEPPFPPEVPSPPRPVPRGGRVVIAPVEDWANDFLPETPDPPDGFSWEGRPPVALPAVEPIESIPRFPPPALRPTAPPSGRPARIGAIALAVIVLGAGAALVVRALGARQPVPPEATEVGALAHARSTAGSTPVPPRDSLRAVQPPVFTPPPVTAPPSLPPPPPEASAAAPVRRAPSLPSARSNPPPAPSGVAPRPVPSAAPPALTVSPEAAPPAASESSKIPSLTVPTASAGLPVGTARIALAGPPPIAAPTAPVRDSSPAVREPVREAAPVVPAPPPPAAPAPSPSETAVRAVLETFRDGYDRLDADSVGAAWPKANVKALGHAFEQLQEQHLDFAACSVVTSGVLATASCKGTAMYVPAVGSRTEHVTPREWTFQLNRLNGRWLIASVDVR